MVKTRHNDYKEEERIKNEPSKESEVKDRTELDKFESQQNVDHIPLEEVELDQKDEKRKHRTKDSSSTEKKHK
ncbi:hypothetical protein ACT6P6_06875 [Priestia endophytica]|uniref:hypothetical protein n=1 Tax=Priestia filamentosa TaxID=1402861 RepID=UPI002E1D8083|nr:hypothetical protein [Priestia filamentosa]